MGKGDKAALIIVIAMVVIAFAVLAYVAITG